jgi:Ribbon-helix-helix protein, copG family
VKKLSTLATSSPAKSKLKKRFVVFQADDALTAQIDAYARATQVSRSWIIRAVLQGWLADKKLGPGEVEP